AQLGTEQVITYPWFLGAILTYSVPIEILRFDVDGTHTAHLDVRWAVRDKHGDLLSSDEAHLTETAADSKREAAVAAQSRTLGQLGTTIAAEIERLDARGKK